MNTAKPIYKLPAVRFDGGLSPVDGMVSELEKGLCQERKSDFIPLDNIYGYPLYSEGFSLCGRARPDDLKGRVEDVSW